MTILCTQPANAIAEGFWGRTAPGPGDAVLWLHGYTLDSGSWGRMWALLDGWHHIGVDLPGHGDTPPMAPVDNLGDLGRRLAAVCRKMTVRHIVALSFGTVAALQTAMEGPECLQSVVLAAPAIAGGPQDQGMAPVYAQMIALYRRCGPTSALRDIWMASRPWRGIDDRPGLRQDLTQLVDRHRWTELSSFTGMLAFFNPSQPPEALARIDTPTLIIHGENEMPVFCRCADILENRLPHCQRRVIAGVDHLCMLQAPETCARLIETHLRGHAIQPPPGDPRPRHKRRT